MGPFLFQTNAAPRLSTRRLSRFGLFFNVLKELVRRCALREYAQDGPVHVRVPPRDIVRVAGGGLDGLEVTKVAHALKDSMCALEIRKC